MSSYKIAVIPGDGTGPEVVAEGIEKDYHARHLKDLGCEYGQGFLYAKPLTGEKAGMLLG